MLRLVSATTHKTQDVPITVLLHVPTTDIAVSATELSQDTNNHINNQDTNNNHTNKQDINQKDTKFTITVSMNGL